MKKSSSSLGGSIGAFIGLIVGIMIPIPNSQAIFTKAITGQTIAGDPQTMLIGGLYIIVAILICAAIGAIIENIAE